MEEKKHIRVKNIIYFIVIIIIVLVGLYVLSKYNYNDFEKGIREKGKTSFSRDSNIKYSNMKSYKVENLDYTDSIFSKTIKVNPNTAYKVTCMVKTQNVQNENNILTGGAQIAIRDTTESSESITGTNDWTKLTLMFNSKNREQVEIGFRLGGYEERTKGTAWFSDFTIEEGNLDNDNEWTIGAFIIENMDITTSSNGIPANYKINMTEEEIQTIEEDIQRLPETLKELSNGKMTATCQTFRIKDPLTTISYDDKNKYYIDPKDVKPLIDQYIKNNEYDYIYVITQFDNINIESSLQEDWIGLGGMDYYGIGYSNIRIPNTQSIYLYKYYKNINEFPEDVLVHEFLHTLERNEKEYGNENIEELHNYYQYNYSTDEINGLRKWYASYMQNTITNEEGIAVGLTDNIYTSKPIHESNFQYSKKLDDLKEPQNIIEEIWLLLNKSIKYIIK